MACAGYVPDSAPAERSYRGGPRSLTSADGTGAGLLLLCQCRAHRLQLAGAGGGAGRVLPGVPPQAHDPGSRSTGAPAALAASGGRQAPLVYSLLRLGLPVVSKFEQPDGGMAFDFLANPGATSQESPKKITGHAQGLITINIAEADDAEREGARQEMAELIAPARALPIGQRAN
jgi:hypothetical protein